MRSTSVRACLLVVVSAFILLTLTSAAWAFGGTSGSGSYVCPFSGGAVDVHFQAQQTSAAYAGCGREVIEYGGRDVVSVKYARVVTLPSGAREAYLAGPVVRSTLPGMSSFWWYLAVHDAPGSANDTIVGRYVKHNGALAAVVAGAWTDYFTPFDSTDLVVWD
jgi:hypothetical protein